MLKALEEHQNKKCLKCPYHWSDGMYSEHGCYIEEGRLGTHWQKLSEMLRRDEYSGCFIPLFIIKIVCLKQVKITLIFLVIFFYTPNCSFFLYISCIAKLQTYKLS